MQYTLSFFITIWYVCVCIRVCPCLRVCVILEIDLSYIAAIHYYHNDLCWPRYMSRSTYLSTHHASNTWLIDDKHTHTHDVQILYDIHCTTTSHILILMYIVHSVGCTPIHILLLYLYDHMISKYIHTYKYIYVQTHLHRNTHVPISKHTHMPINIHTYMLMRTHTRNLAYS